VIEILPRDFESLRIERENALTAPPGPAATYVDMMRHNIREIADALK